VTSTFVNRNSFATYAGIGLVAICALLIQFYRHRLAGDGGSARYRIAAIIEATGRGGLWRVAAAFVILVALLLTQSRGGITATLLGLFVLGVLTLGRRRSLDQRPIVLAGAAVVAIVILFFGESYISRLSEDGFYDQGRIAVYTIALRSILDAPLHGYGYGTFIDVFPMFRDQSIGVSGRWEMAHDTYLELFQGLGVIFAAMLVASVAVLVLRCLKGAATRRRNATVPATAAAVAFLVGAHSFVDFSLQMQSIAITFMALLGAGVAQSVSSREALND
jgi:O-antigen ligase